jgi:rod shape determining protein RodA
MGFLIIFSPILLFFLKDYQRQRILIFLNPGLDPLGSGYNIIQSQIAIGSGGIFGKGFLNGTQSQLNFIPAHHTDFIFSVLTEEWGFVGAFILIVIYMVFILRGIKIAMSARDTVGALLASGITVLLAFQVIININMTIGLLPVVGIPLPFMSYGGSSLFVNMIAVGILLNIRRMGTIQLPGL